MESKDYTFRLGSLYAAQNREAFLELADEHALDGEVLWRVLEAYSGLIGMDEELPF